MVNRSAMQNRICMTHFYECADWWISYRPSTCWFGVRESFECEEILQNSDFWWVRHHMVSLQTTEEISHGFAPNLIGVAGEGLCKRAGLVDPAVQLNGTQFNVLKVLVLEFWSDSADLRVLIWECGEAGLSSVLGVLIRECWFQRSNMRVLRCKTQFWSESADLRVLRCLTQFWSDIADVGT